MSGKPIPGARSTTPTPPLTGGEFKKSPLSRGGQEGLANASLTKRGVLPYNKNLTTLARENRKSPTPAENKVWHEVLRMRQFADFKFLRQKPLAGYIVDFYCSELQLAIEIDGESHAASVEYDAERTNVLEALGLTVVRYTNDEVLQNIQGVFDDLSQRLTPLAPLDRGEQKISSHGKWNATERLSPSPVKGRAGEGL